MLYFTFNTYKRETKTLEEKHEAYIVLRYIEKRLLECNQESMVYYRDKNLFEGKDYNNKTAYVDLSGRLSTRPNTLITFYKFKNEVRVNTNSENNIISNQIKDILVHEIVEGELLEIEVITNEMDYSRKIRLRLKYRVG